MKKKVVIIIVFLVLFFICFAWFNAYFSSSQKEENSFSNVNSQPEGHSRLDGHASVVISDFSCNVEAIRIDETQAKSIIYVEGNAENIGQKEAKNVIVTVIIQPFESIYKPAKFQIYIGNLDVGEKRSFYKKMTYYGYLSNVYDYHVSWKD